MRRQILLVLCTLAFSSFSEMARSQWQLIGGVTGERLFSAFTVSQDEVFVGGKNAILLHSADAGDTWTEVVHNGGEDIMAINFPTDLIGITAGGAGEIMRTADGGGTWTLIDSDINDDLEDLSFPNASTGYTVGTNGLVAKTNDSGQSWQILSAGTGDDIVAVHFITENTGYILTTGNELLITNDAGINWVATALNPSDWNDLFFLNPSTGFIVGGGGEIMETSDGGLTWLPALSPTGSNLLSIDFSDAMHGHISGDNGEILSTNDGGLNWVAEEPLTPERLHGIHFFDSYFGFAVGRQGTIIRYNLQTGLVDSNSDKSADIAVWPNPFSDKIIVSSAKNLFNAGEIKIHDLAGRLFKYQSVTGNNGSFAITLETEELVPGFYILTFYNSSGKVMSMKLLKE